MLCRQNAVETNHAPAKTVVTNCCARIRSYFDSAHTGYNKREIPSNQDCPHLARQSYRWGCECNRDFATPTTVRKRRSKSISQMESCFAKGSPNLRPRQVPNYTNAKQNSHSGVSEISYNARFMHLPWKEEQPIDTNSNNCPAGPVSQLQKRNA